MDTPVAEPILEAQGISAIRKQMVGREQVLDAAATLRKYKEGKANLEARIVENEEWHRLRHWEFMRRKKKGLDGNTEEEIKPVSAWLFNSLANKHADAMDNYPSPNVLPREKNDKAEATRLSSILPVILDLNEFRDTYSDAVDEFLKSGTCVLGTFWDKVAHNGRGDISVQDIDVLSLFWESGVEDIQESRNLFHTQLMANDVIEATWPETAGKLTSHGAESAAKYMYDDSVDTSDKSEVVDWYYKKLYPSGKTVLHYVKYVGDIVLYATENEPDLAERGLYDHGEYPFVFVPLNKCKGTPCGFGYIDVGKSVQEYIDRGDAAIMKNLLVNSRPRYFAKKSGGVSLEDFTDLSKDIVEVEGSLNDDNIRPITIQPLSSVYLSVIEGKIEQLKETTGNRDVSNGGTTGGVTAAAALAVMQEAGSKLSRDSNGKLYAGFKKVCKLAIALMRQFYEAPRYFRITGENGEMEFAEYTNAGLIPQREISIVDGSEIYRVPEFDIEVTAEKASPYSRLAQNELALQFYNAGFFAPQNADAALACLEIMDFPRKEFVIERVTQNGGMYQQMLMMQEQLERLMAMVQGGRPSESGAQSPESAPSPNGEATLDNALGEPPHVQAARERYAESTEPR